MENILRLYRLDYDEKYPLICFDERPCFLIGDVIEGLDAKSGQVRKEHYEYEKNGSFYGDHGQERVCRVCEKTD